jgi:hypothetical protein
MTGCLQTYSLVNKFSVFFFHFLQIMNLFLNILPSFFNLLCYTEFDSAITRSYAFVVNCIVQKLKLVLYSSVLLDILYKSNGTPFGCFTVSNAT